MAAIEEMMRQVGGVVTDDNGVALRGLMIRHVVLPENIARGAFPTYRAGSRAP